MSRSTRRNVKRFQSQVPAKAAGDSSAQPKSAAPSLRLSANLSALRSWLSMRIFFEAPLIAVLQSRLLCRTVDIVSTAFSLLGTHEAYLLLLPAMFWFSHASSPVRVLALGLLGVLAWTNYGTGFLKDLLCLPRPPLSVVQRKAETTASEQEFGFPSTHTANSLGIVLFTLYWLSLRTHGINPDTVLVLTPLLISYAVIVAWSRILKGMHSYIDILGGAIVGIVVAGIQVAGLDLFERALATQLAGSVVSRLIFGAAVLILWRFSAKTLTPALLSKSNASAQETKKTRKSKHTKLQVKGLKADTSNNDTWVKAVTKYVVYFGIGVLATDAIPVMAVWIHNL
eukprot:jgi/Hompol1/2050/HPOL_005829-RA